MTVAELRADYESEKDDVDYYRSPAAMRIMSVMPAILDVLERGIEWKKSGYSTNINSPLCSVWRALEEWDV